MADKIVIELTFNRRYNLGNFNHKEYTIKLSGTQELVDKQLDENKQKLINYVSELSNLIEIAHDANLLKDRAEKISQEPEAGRGSGGGSN
jgi:hypothetical protein